MGGKDCGWDYSSSKRWSNGKKSRGREPVIETTSKIAAHILGMDGKDDWKKYRRNFLWKKGSKIFHANLLPLGERGTSKGNWPNEEYRRLFGYPKRNDDYFRAVVEKRYPKIQELVRRCCPQAIICFGKDYWQYFYNLFDIEESQLQKGRGDVRKGGKAGVRYSKDKKIIFAYHFAGRYGVMNKRKEISEIAKLLKDWGVQLPNQLPAQ